MVALKVCSCVGEVFILFYPVSLCSQMIVFAHFRRDEIGVIPCPEARCNRSPIVLVENKLGVESWCIKFLLPYVHNKLLLYRQRKHWLDRDGRSPERDEHLTDSRVEVNEMVVRLFRSFG